MSVSSVASCCCTTQTLKAASGPPRHSSPYQHNSGNTQSVFTSWTTDPGMAHAHAMPGGVVLKKTVPTSSLIESPDIFNESEVLLEGIVSGAEVIPFARF